MEFDRFTITLLLTNPDAPEIDDARRAELQDAHMAHLADLHEQGVLLAAGPLSDPHFRGLSILNVDAERAQALKEADPAVQAGIFTVQSIPWMVPGGAMHFSQTFFPRGVADV
jgi:uncharacterized protein YciI